MSSSEAFSENIKLSLPVNAAYVSAARLTASSIANRMVFDIDEIEDIKAAVSEACTFVIKKFPSNIQDEFTIVFSVKKEMLTVEIGTTIPIKIEPDSQEMSLIMIKALMDEVNYTESDQESFRLSMSKEHKAISFN